MFRFYIRSKPIVRAVHSLTCIMRPKAILILSKGEALWVITKNKISAFATFRCHQRKRILKSGSLMMKQGKQEIMAKKLTWTGSLTSKFANFDWALKADKKRCVAIFSKKMEMLTTFCQRIPGHIKRLLWCLPWHWGGKKCWKQDFWLKLNIQLA